MAGARPDLPSPTISVSRSQIIQTPIAPSSDTLTMDFTSSIRPCLPNMRLRPAAGLSFDVLGAQAPGRKLIDKIGRTHFRTPVPLPHPVCRLLLLNIQYLEL